MDHSGEPSYDVAIIGGGPAGSTAGALLAKYAPDLKVIILEKERFPRDHVGESQLPQIGRILDEMGVWDEVEAAGFPIKIGASYTWGQTDEPWEIEFLPLSEVKEGPRPARFEGWRQRAAFQVDRAAYDDILLRHAATLGCEVRQETRVSGVHRAGDRITALELADGERVTARWYVDATGHVGALRRALGVEVEVPTSLQNVAFWNYWQGAERGALVAETTRVQVRSVPFGWIWYIPLSNDRTSVGLVCPVTEYKRSGKSPQEIYDDALSRERRVSALLERATVEGELQSTTDWSFIARRLVGENWFLAGESCGFADPILAAGLTLTHSGARDCAYTLLELFRGEHDPAWLRQRYDLFQKRVIRQHMRFADYWYSGNGCFTDLQEHCRRIARDAGLKLDASSAWRWLSNGGLDDVVGQAVLGSFDVASIKQVQWRLSTGQVTYEISGKNHFSLSLAGAERIDVGVLENGRIRRVGAYRRADRVLPEHGVQALLLKVLGKPRYADELLAMLKAEISASAAPGEAGRVYTQAMLALEVMVNEHWVRARRKGDRPALQLDTPKDGDLVYSGDRYAGLLDED